MNTSNPRKALSLLSALTCPSRDLGPYLRGLPCRGRQPADLELPWLAFGASRQIKRHLTPSRRVFEPGSGGSSFLLARRAAHVHSVERHQEWHVHLAGPARRRGLNNRTCRLEHGGLPRRRPMPLRGEFNRPLPSGPGGLNLLWPHPAVSRAT